ncbi:hypothetical protein D9758_013680 [Tetrapyrgos nigripes]|uniref:F-box domain-containing protein n=1 Tax=Tetrapyrgos nigripes TaxID=182062 RepID=A0A8H5FMU4_9AGAR|nr:hypothetical protein D9758_013680 [Tetrapyrgos nigripes]
MSHFTEYLSGRQIHETIFLSAADAAFLKSRLQDEEERIFDLTTELETILLEISQRKRTVAKLKDILSPIRRVPQEVLGEVFSRYVELRESEYKKSKANPVPYHFPKEAEKRLYRMVPPALLISHVCSHWRRVAQSTPRLWTLLRIPASAPRLANEKLPPKELVVDWLQRSGCLPVHLSIRYAHTGGGDEASYPNILAPICQRLCTVKLHVKYDFMVNLFGNLDDITFPNLEKFLVRVDGPRLPAEGHLPRLGRAFKHAPRLWNLKFFHEFDSLQRGIQSAVDFPFPTSQITILVLHTLSHDPIILREVMCACPLLEICQFWNVPDFPTNALGHRDLPFCELPCLKRLTFQFSGVFGSPQILNDLCLPALEELALIERGVMVIPISPYLTTLYQRSRSKLRFLSLRRCLFGSVEDFFDVLKLVPSLRTLALTDCGLDIPTFCRGLRATPEAKVPVPNLTKLSIAEEQDIDAVMDTDEDPDPPLSTDIDIAEMVLSRWKPYPPEQDVTDAAADGGTVKWPITKLTRGFTLEAYCRALEPEAMSKLEECKQEGMALVVRRGKTNW